MQWYDKMSILIRCLDKPGGGFQDGICWTMRQNTAEGRVSVKGWLVIIPIMLMY